MSGVYAYCVVPEGVAPPPGLLGIHDTPVRLHAGDGLGAWVSELDAAPRPELAHVTAHHQVVASAFGRATPVPVRFGSWMPDAAALVTRLAEDVEELRAALASVHGRVELGVRVQGRSGAAPDEAVAAPDEPVADPVDGRAYLRALSRHHARRRARRERLEAVAESLRARVGGLSRAEHVRFEEPEVVSVAHLVDRAGETDYRARVADFAREQEGAWRIHLTGPWPPYSFVAS